MQKKEKIKLLVGGIGIIIVALLMYFLGSENTITRVVSLIVIVIWLTTMLYLNRKKGKMNKDSKPQQ